MNVGVLACFWITVLSRYMPKNGVAGSYGNSVFRFLRSFHTVLHSDRLNSHSHQQCRRAPRRDCWILTNPSRFCETKHISIQMCNDVCRLNGTVFNYLMCAIIIGSSLTWGQIRVEPDSQVWTRQVCVSRGVTGVRMASHGSWVWKRGGALGRPFGGGGKGPRQPWLLEAWTTWAGFLGGEICWAWLL